MWRGAKHEDTATSVSAVLLAGAKVNHGRNAFDVLYMSNSKL
jgi:hypothetical protein